MNIVIVGAGKVGYFLAKRLNQNKHKVSIIDKDKNICDEIAKELDILVINGDACEPDILMQADIACANVLAAVTGDDEDNLIVCQLAKEKFNIHRTVGRVNNPDNEKTFSELGIDVPVDDTKIIAKINNVHLNIIGPLSGEGISFLHFGGPNIVVIFDKPTFKVTTFCESTPVKAVGKQWLGFYNGCGDVTDVLERASKILSESEINTVREDFEDFVQSSAIAEFSPVFPDLSSAF